MIEKAHLYGELEHAVKSNYDEEDEYQDGDVNFFTKQFNKLSLRLGYYSRCYLRVFDGLSKNYLEFKKEMELHNAVMSVQDFRSITTRAGLTIEFGTADTKLFEGKSLLQVRDRNPSGNVVVYHEVEVSDSVGHISEKYYTLKRGANKFRPKNIGVLHLV